VRPDRERKSSGSETAFAADLTDPEGIEAGVLAMADDVWAWCEKTGGLGRTVTVKIKWADFQQSTRSRSQDYVETADQLQAAALSLIRSLFPPAKAVRLVGVTLSNLWRGAEDEFGLGVPAEDLSLPDSPGEFGVDLSTGTEMRGEGPAGEVAGRVPASGELKGKREVPDRSRLEEGDA
jgi:hypothetical protein